MANVRTSARRGEKEGLRVLFFSGQVTEHLYLQQMDQISHHWLQHKGSSEMGFSMGCFEPEGDPEQVYALAVDPQDHVHAFVSFIPIYGRHGWGLDLMRRAEPCAPGTMELLLVRCIEYLKNMGAQKVSLGLAPLSNANEENGTFLENGLDFLTRHFGDPQKNHSLFNFKKKFQPAWESRYLIYDDALSLPKVGLALNSVHREDSSLLRSIRRSLSTWQRNIRARQEQARVETARA
jgi:phosphatidylglycerol lysyltransferase